MLTFIQKIHKEINEENRPDVIGSFKDSLVESFPQTAQEKTFYSLPLEIILDVISKVNFSSFHCDASFVKTIVKNTVAAHPNEKETLFLLHFIKTNFIPLTFNDCINILSLFNNSELLMKLGKLYFESGYELKFKEKEEELKSLQSFVNDMKDGSKTLKKPVDYEPDIFIAAAHGKLTTIQYQIEQENVDINKTTQRKYEKENIMQGSSILHIASQYGHFKIVQYLVEKGADVEAKDEDQKTHLHKACQKGLLANVQYLVEKDANIGAKDKEEKAPLHIACENNNLPVVQYLIQTGANIEAKDKNQLTPLHVACQKGHLPIVQYLIEKGADIESKDCLEGTPLHYASFYGKTDVVQYLVSKGANKNSKDKFGRIPLGIVCEYGEADKSQRDAISKLLKHSFFKGKKGRT